MIIKGLITLRKEDRRISLTINLVIYERIKIFGILDYNCDQDFNKF